MPSAAYERSKRKRMQHRHPPWRQEHKFLLYPADYTVLYHRVKAVLAPDTHQVSENGYTVNSLYFDDSYLTAYRQKLSGLEQRAKFRVRCYNQDNRLLLLEQKTRCGVHVAKAAVPLTLEEYHRMLSGDFSFMPSRADPVMRAFYERHATRRMRPVLTVGYKRQAFTYPFGNVRITFDLHIEASASPPDLFNRAVTYQTLPNACGVLEVKYDEYLPSAVAELLTGVPLLSQPVSKYILSMDTLMEAGHHV